MLLKFGVSTSRDEDFFQESRGNTNRDAPRGGSWYVTTGLGSTEESARYWHQSLRQENAKQRSEGSQGGRPIRT